MEISTRPLHCVDAELARTAFLEGRGLSVIEGMPGAAPCYGVASRGLVIASSTILAFEPAIEMLGVDSAFKISIERFAKLYTNDGDRSLRKQVHRISPWWCLGLQHPLLHCSNLVVVALSLAHFQNHLSAPANRFWDCALNLYFWLKTFIKFAINPEILRLSLDRWTAKTDTLE